MIDTAKANADICVGLAANQIGERVRVIIVKMGEQFVPLVNAQIVKCSKSTYEAEEACLSHEGTKKTMRYASIEVVYRDRSFNKK
ncbi:MAG: peptide deformylase, partial [Cellulosilyticaceae bacterium]